MLNPWGCAVQLEEMSKFKYLGWVLDELRTDVAKCHRHGGRERKFAGAIRSLVNARGLQLEGARVLHEALLMPVRLYGRETMIWREKERFGKGY